jgi:hypothetical protein
MNIGIMNVKYQNVLHVDNDIIIPKKELEIGLENIIRNKNIFFPYEWFWDLSEDVTKKFKCNLDFNYLETQKHAGLIERYGNDGSGQCVKAGGCYFTNKDFYMSIAGNEEQQFGYGAEDDAWHEKVRIILQYENKWSYTRNYMGNIYHLYHKRTDYVWLREQKFYKDNCIIMKKIINMNYEELLKYIEECKKTFFNPDKYLSNNIKELKNE